MSPPGLPSRILARALGDDPARAAILGDLNEDFRDWNGNMMYDRGPYYVDGTAVSGVTYYYYLKAFDAYGNSSDYSKVVGFTLYSAANLGVDSLPDSWEDYLQGLSGKERHEIRRKFRRLYAAGKVNLRCIEDPALVSDAMDQFLTLFRANRKDKAAFMTGSMPAFFRSLALNLASRGFLKLYFLDLDDRTIAATFCIAHRSTVYLYNNGYDDAFRSLSIGLLSKVLTIKDSIRNRWRIYDFLKGAEAYKRRLGGKPININRCVIALNR